MNGKGTSLDACTAIAHRWKLNTSSLTRKAQALVHSNMNLHWRDASSTSGPGGKMPSRAERLQERFDNLRKALEMSVGKERADGAAWAAWLMSIQYMHRQSLKQMADWATADNSFKGFNSSAREAAYAMIDRYEGESELALRSFHAELCKYLKVDNDEVRQLAISTFEQVINDICFQRG